ncbi:hypothetical protein GHI93_01080 [Lactococcus hircilactis]|uniref:Uncharacterized protein n=1 Tax=Lactococcus hircilactis TaxID=1494462 RepID=A0A7X2CZU6_9LACT|nr:hypothetical protein [Lactococcus hircilactis]MQW38543.1 hypothetical protein [Lactococcus hircilactis]
MITSLTILSSIAIIVTAIIAFAEYLAGKARHENTLAIARLDKQEEDFIKWFYDYLHMSQILMRVTIQLNMDRLEQIHFEDATDSGSQRRVVRINENTLSRDRYTADLTYQMMILNLIIDERKSYFKRAKARIRENHETLIQDINDFSKEIHTTYDERMKDETADFRAIMTDARTLARKTVQEIERSNHEMGDQVKEDLLALEDEIESHFRRKK